MENENITNNSVNDLRKIILFEWFSILGVLAAIMIFLSAQIYQQSCRSDKLYEMFYELIKEKNEKR